jgi:predicted amidohydrolase YtcJ
MEIVMLKKILGSRLLSHARTRRVRAAMALTPLALGAVLVACGGGGSDAAPVVSADMVLKNGYVYTVDGSRSVAQSVAVKDGKIVYVGDDQGGLPWAGPGTEVVDLQGRMLTPGFIDGHNHVSDHPESLFWLSTRPFSTIEDIGAALQKFRADHPGLQQLRAIGWDAEMLKKLSAERGLTPAQLLDQYVSDIPVLILHDWHHDLWVNSKALANAHIDANTPDPAGAFFVRVPGTAGHGVPNGVAREFGAMSLIEKALPEPEFTQQQFRAAILDWQRLAAARGVTAVLVPQPRPTVNFYEALLALDKEGLLTARYDVAVWADETRGVQQLPELLATRDRYKGQGRNFKIDTVKIFGTGSSAWEESDALVWDQARLNETVAALDKEGLRVYIHDIGPVASYNAMLDAFAHARERNGVRDARHTITHVNAEANGAIARFKQLDVRADINERPYPKAFFDAGVKATLSSDYPVREFYPSSRLGTALSAGVSLEQAIAAHTIGGAELIFAEKETGSIEVGKAADLVVLDRKLFGLTPQEVSAARPLMTVAAGKVVFRSAALGGKDAPASSAPAPVVGEAAHRH